MSKCKEGLFWVIEMQGPVYLSARQLGGYEFYWTADVQSAIRFFEGAQADMVMMAVRQLRPDLFPACLPTPIRAVEHEWFGGATREDVRKLEEKEEAE